jgi:hypothetical protein
MDPLRCNDYRSQDETRLAFRAAGLREPRFLSQLCINIRQVFPQPFVTFPAQQGVFPVVFPASIHGTLLLGGKFFLHPGVLSFSRKSYPDFVRFVGADLCRSSSGIRKTGPPLGTILKSDHHFLIELL